MSALSTAVKWYNQSFSGIPTLNASAGSMTGILDALLANGFNTSSVSQIVVTSGVARATLTSGGAFARKAVALIAGCSETALNGEKRITLVGSGYLEYDATGVADGTYNTGTITAKYAPMGWEILFTDTNKRIYRSLNVADRDSVVLYVDDTNPAGFNMAANVAGTYRSMAKVVAITAPTDINTFTQLGLVWWIKSNSSTDTSARNYMICGDDLGFFFSGSPANSSTYGNSSEYFGKLNNLYRPGDMFGTVLTGWDGYGGGNSGAVVSSTPGNVSNAQAAGNTTQNFGYMSYAAYKYIARSFSQLGVAVGCTFYGNSLAPSFSGQTCLAYPCPVDSGLHYVGDVICHENSQGPRGTMPGFYQLLHARPFGIAYMLENVASDPDKTFMTWNSLAFVTGTTPTSASVGEFMFDIIGPWR